MSVDSNRQKQLLAAAQELADAAARASFLDHACADDVELRGQIEALLAAPSEQRTCAYLPPAEGVGAVVAGRYRLLQQIGEGGFGVVFMAEQQEPVRRTVALKIIKPGMDTAQVIARFESERQALALMDHPNIAKVLDAGATESGRPYFVMELVKGVPITEFCDKNHMQPRQRLKLFIDVCHAIQHAHHKGVIHRDVKPSNVMVTLHDGMPVVKVIDFGVAKATVQKLTEKTLFTAYGQMVGTPAYMSPEQAEMSGLDIDTRSDVFSLGVLLYELLTGTTPLESKRLREAGHAELLRLIVEVDPPRPSTRLSSLGDSATALAGNRGLDVRRLVRVLSGDLDWIVMKALEKDRNRRYGTPGDFAEDVNRYLRGEAIVVRPPSSAYRVKKFVTRNKGPVIAVGLVLVALLAGMIGTSVGLLRADRARGDEANHRAKAERARDRARQALDDMTSSMTGDSLVRQSEITPEQRRFLTEVLSYYREFASESADDEQGRARSAQAAFRVGGIENRLGHSKESLAAFRAAADIYEALVAEFPAGTEYRQALAATRNNLGMLLGRLGDVTSAEEQYAAAERILDELIRESPTTASYRYFRAWTHEDWGRTNLEIGKLDTAERQYRKALAFRKQLAADRVEEPLYRAQWAETILRIANVLEQRRGYADADENYRMGVSILEKLTAEHADSARFRGELAHGLIGLGQFLASRGKRPEAETHLRRAVEIREQLAVEFPSGGGSQWLLATSFTSLGLFLKESGRPTEGIELYRKALPIQERLVVGFSSVQYYAIDYAGTCCNLGNALGETGKPADAVPWFQKAIDTLRPVLRGEPRNQNARRFAANSYWGRAEAYDHLKRHAEATADWEEAVKMADGDHQKRIRYWRVLSRNAAGLHAEAAREVDDLSQAESWSADQWYNFACVYAVAATKIAEQRGPYSDRAMAMLNRAVSAGYKNGAHAAKDKDLDVLRDREDFKKLLESLMKSGK